MKFSERWLREWVNPPISTAELAQQLTMAGLEVDSVTEAAPPFDGVVVGRVLSVEPHPDAEKLRVCAVDVGGTEPLRIVCGAPNVHPGMHAPAALVGAVLPGELRIKKAKLRGVESSGMLCSAKELGLSEAAEGLMELPADATPGTDLRAWLGLDDRIVEVDLTPNRSDCLGIAGIAREVGALNRCALHAPTLDPVPAGIDDTFPVELTAAEECPRYVGRVIRGVNVGALTPLWMQERLRRSGIRSLGPVVDVTNYVLLELGQPLHAFDLAQLEGGIRVRRAAAGEHLTLLDGREIELDPQTLVIADHRRVLAMAGVMGGRDSGVEPGTRDLFLESAFFTPHAIAGRARAYGLHTESSHRFERGVDPQLQRRAAERATALLLQICGGQAGPVIEVVAEANLPAREPIGLRSARLRAVLGLDLPADEVGEILARLGMTVERPGADWHVTPPSFRFDIGIEVDLIEELARVYGYDRLPSTRPQAPLAIAPQPEARVGLERLRRVLVDRGFQEAITYSFVDPALQRRVDPGQEPIALANPLSAELAVMRTSLWPGLLRAVQHNQNRQQPRVRLFESGLRFLRDSGGVRQDTWLAGVVTGSAQPEQWGEPQRPVDFFDLKGDVEALCELAGDGWGFIPARHPALHPGQSARIERGGAPAGWIGALHPAIEHELDLSGPVLLFELDLTSLQQTRLPRFAELSRFPAIRRDIAVVVDESVSAAAVQECIRLAAGGLLQSLTLFDVYRGKGLDSGKKSLALALILQDCSRTLKDTDVDAVIAQVVKRLSRELDAALRE
jgi:phenylalanyl-tRNA synthetase beta chain